MAKTRIDLIRKPTTVPRMKPSLKIAVTLLVTTLILNLSAESACAKGGSGHGGKAASTSRSVGRPYYGGGRHTKSHGGAYPGSVGPSHVGGHYVNPKSGDRYGIHGTGGQKGASLLMRH